MADKVPPDNRSVNTTAGDISNVSGQVNIASGHIFQVGQGATVLIGSPTDAISGLVALRELLKRSSDVYTAAVAFRTDFRVTYEEIDRLGDYKDLHDLLHRLQFHCYRGIVQALTRFPDDEITLNDLTDYTLTLDEIAEELRQVAIRSLMPKQEIRWISDITLARVDLHNAIDALNLGMLKKVVWRLNRLLTTQPARINALLNRSARALRLSSLLNALKDICNNLTRYNLDSEKIGVFQTGVDSLERLDTALNLLVENHDHWQELANELRRIDGLIDHDLQELEMSWTDVKQNAEPLYIMYSEEWSNALMKESNNLDEALKINNPAKVRRCFYSYHRRVNDRFYIIDIELKALCDNLRKIGIPLASVLEIIE